jgi:hypothetical protein
VIRTVGVAPFEEKGTILAPPWNSFDNSGMLGFNKR